MLQFIIEIHIFSLNPRLHKTDLKEILVNKIKNLFMLFSVILFAVNFNTTKAKEIGVNIINEGESKAAEGFHLRFEVCQVNSPKLHDSLYSSPIEAPSTNLQVDLKDMLKEQLRPEGFLPSTMKVHLFDKQDIEIAVGENMHIFHHLSELSGLEVSFDALAKKVSLNTKADTLAMALLRAPND